ncbi:hypothetical protein DSL72_006741 [Monilinia vaccinii-corymbosi]|uniref:NAD(P)-binding protein n=1 Tax=Monilinia vaccinii-corymbosi TaxID=61207 RepID=A0A8A3PN69_9HELO|nr:hypothetical protein DSL72_006741 [Monilinia vaccinii-corymbosi]
MSRLAQKVIIITGPSSGLGLAIALLCAREGYKLVACADLAPFPTTIAAQNTPIENDSMDSKVDRSLDDDDKGKRVNLECTQDMICAEEEEVENVVKVAVEKGARLDAIINNAGTGSDGCLMNYLPSESFGQVMKLNTQSPFNGCKYALAQFLNQDIDNHGHRGCIMNIASAAGLAGVRYAAANSASKAAVVGMTKSLAIDYAQSKIVVNALCPGFFKSAMTQNLFSDDMATSYMKAVTPHWGRRVEISRISPKRRCS